jgi:hypothetical protein
VAEHREMVEFYNKHNAILEIEIRDNDFCIKQVRKYNMQQQQQPDENNNNNNST